MADKKVNYTKEQEKRMLEVYDAEASREIRDGQVAQLAIEFSKKKGSIIAKLSNLSVYVAKVYTNKNGEKSVQKGALVTLIASAIGSTDEALDTLVKANKTVLEEILAFVAPVVEESVEADEESVEADEESVEADEVIPEAV